MAFKLCISKSWRVFVAHGTFIGHLRLEKRKPTPVPIDSELLFGASTRHYVIRERPQPKPLTSTDDKNMDELEGGLLGLPDTEPELDVS